MIDYAIFTRSAQAVTPSNLWSHWAWEPVTIALLLLASGAYNAGVGHLWARAGRGRGIRGWQSLAFTAALLSTLIALLSPLDALSAALFSAHMLQHMLLIFVAAPLFALSAAPTAFFWALPLRLRRRVGRWTLIRRLRALWGLAARPLVAWVIYAVSLWVWHAPSLYQAALENDLIHTLEHGFFLLSSYLFWSVLLRPRRRSPAHYGSGVLYIFTTSLHSSGLSALLLFSTQLWYPAYGMSAAAWGLTPLGDQQLAGLLMWLPMGFIYLGAAAALLYLWLNSLEAETLRRELPRARLPAGLEPQTR